MNRRWLETFAISLILIASTFSVESEKRKGPIIRQVDRILVESPDPKALFDFFAHRLKLPEAYPLTDNQGYVSGGVGAGNANIEFYRYADSGGVSRRNTGKAQYAGIAFEPYPLADALRELTIGGISYNPPQPFIAALPDGSKGVQWTIVPLPSFSRPAMSIFLFEYSPAYLRVDIRRKQLGNRLALSNGGPLGIKSILEIVIASKNLDRENGAWKNLLGAPTRNRYWSVGAGPSIRLIDGEEDRIEEIAFTVKSLSAAKEFLKTNQLLGPATAKELWLDQSKIQSLKIRLIN